MQFLENLKPWLGRKSVQGAILVTFILIMGVVVSTGDKEETMAVELNKSVVSLTTSSEFAGGQSLSLIGSVRAFTEAKITSEKSGRVTGVNVNLGQQVSAGTILMTLENASERASVLQAEGVYEAAQAAAAQTNFGTSEAETRLFNARLSAINTVRSAYTTANSVVVSNIDNYFSNPNSTIPGLRVGGQGRTPDLNNERVAYQDLLPEWNRRVDSVTPDEPDLLEMLSYSRANVQRTIAFLDIFLFVFDQKRDEDYASDELIFSNLRGSLLGTLSSIDSARGELISATEALERANASATGGTASAADAQVKQALGSLRAAQANLSKTVLRTPIAGTVNAISLRTGDFINSFSQVAIVANNNALEVVTYISDNELNLLSEGDIVMIEETIEGIITEIAPAVDSATRKTEVRIAIEGAGIKNGDTVRITKEISLGNIRNETIRIPLTAVKFDRENGSVFMVENDVLVSRAVVLGNIFGNSVEVLEGVSNTDQFVVDSRGLVEGEEVKIIN